MYSEYSVYRPVLLTATHLHVHQLCCVHIFAFMKNETLSLKFCIYMTSVICELLESIGKWNHVQNPPRPMSLQSLYKTQFKVSEYIWVTVRDDHDYQWYVTHLLFNLGLNILILTWPSAQYWALYMYRKISELCVKLKHTFLEDLWWKLASQSRAWTTKTIRNACFMLLKTDVLNVLNHKPNIPSLSFIFESIRGCYRVVQTSQQFWSDEFERNFSCHTLHLFHVA